MNDKAREILVSAALNGTPQIKYRLADDDGGRCAMGVLMEACDREIFLSVRRFKWHTAFDMRVMGEYDIDGDEWREIATANNNGWDFLTIARKIGNPEEANG